MMDSLPYRNDAAIVFRRLIRSLPRRKGVLGVATCDKGLPANAHGAGRVSQICPRPCPGGRDASAHAKGRTRARSSRSGARYAHGESDSRRGRRAGLPRLRSPGGGCQFLGTAATSQVVAEALGADRSHTLPSPLPGSRSGATWPVDRLGRLLALVARRADNSRYPDRRRHPQRDDRSRGLRRVNQPVATHPGHCIRGGPASAHRR